VKRDDIFNWIKSVDSEYRVATLAVTNLRDQARQDLLALKAGDLVLADVVKCLTNLEATYVVRLFAEFESALRIYWKESTKRRTCPQINQLIASIGARRDVPENTIGYAHEVREFRNGLVHEKIQSASLTFGDCRSYLAKFLSFLPPHW
jgi:hypothetical protein